MNLTLLATEDWYVTSHRLPILRAAVASGWRVTVVTRVRDHGDAIRAAGAHLVPLEIDRGGMNPVADASLVIRLHALYRKLRPDLVHHVGMKPILYGGWAARFAGVPRVLHAFAGLGALYSDANRGGLLRRTVERGLRPVTRRSGSRVLVQNDDDANLLADRGLATAETIRVIRGSGVDLERFVATPESSDSVMPMVLFPARLLIDKGIREFVAAADRLKGSARFVLVGERDDANPSCCSEVELRQWIDSGTVEWWGHRPDMPAVLSQASLIVLPSYREGMPKALLEAAAVGRPVIATSVPGCRDAVVDGQTGLLVPPRDVDSLAAAIRALLSDPVRRRTMGRAAREHAEAEFSDRAVAEQTVTLYQEMMS